MNPAETEPDRFWMGQALALGALAEGRTSPNPRVGCLVIRDGRVVGRGFHRAHGLPHAEVVALDEARGAAAGATLYVNLEPCAHHGRTPPCTERIVRAGVRRVVASIQDPNPLVDGRGFAELERAGVTVQVGLLGAEARRINAPFVHFHRHGRPRVTIKAAASLDGMLSARGGRSKWITGAAARCFAHRLRMRHDAILVGAQTIRADDPRLTVRLEGIHAPRLRVVLAPTLDLDPGARIFERGSDGSPKPRVYASKGLGAEAIRPFADRAEIVEVDGDPGSLDLRAILGDLAGQGVQSVLVEGGGRTIAAFEQAALADAFALFVAPKLLGAREATPLLDRLGVDDPAGAGTLENVVQIGLDRDLVLMGAYRRGAC